MQYVYGEGAFPAFSGDPKNNEEYMNYSLNTNVAYAGKTIHVYVATFAGDFMSPQSEDYINFKINSWYKASAQNDEISNIRFAQGYSPSLVSYGMKQSNYEQSKLAEGFGPYIKNNIKLTVKDILNSGTCKITFDDYKTEA